MRITIPQSLLQLAANRSTSLLWYHSVGTTVNKLVPRKRGPVAAAMRQIAQEAFQDGKMLSTLRVCSRFASIYSERELSQLDGVNWKQVQYLISVEDKRLRKQLTRFIKTKKPATRELASAIQELLGKRTNGGRKPRPLQLARKAVYRETARLCNEVVRCLPDWFRSMDDAQADPSDLERDSLIATTRESLQAAARVINAELQRLPRRPR